jgi:hypothetical protein
MTTSFFGSSLRHHGLEIGPDQFAVRFDAGKRARPGAGRDDDVLGVYSPSPFVPFGAGCCGSIGLLGRLADGDLALAGKLRLAPDDVDLVLLHQQADAAVQARRRRRASGRQRFHVGEIPPSRVRP